MDGGRRETRRERRSEKDGERERVDSWRDEEYGCKVVTERMAGKRMPKRRKVEECDFRQTPAYRDSPGPIKESGRVMWVRELSH